MPGTVEGIQKKMWALSPQVRFPEAYRELTNLTGELIKIYELQGRLSANPFMPITERKINLPFENLSDELKDSTCLVTGGFGCVGSVLIKELLEFKVKRVIVLDLNIPNNSSALSKMEEVDYVRCDVRDFQKVLDAFLLYSPDFVFHMAAQRNPGYAESHIVETVSTNVLGTLNVVKACEATRSVKQMVFSSTGKASRYFTEEIYAATKKTAEFIIDTFAKESRVRYSMVRFTHILDNSLMNAQLKNDSARVEYLSVHSPGKYVTAQNAMEAAHLMLNALLHAQQRQSNLLFVRHLPWPVESLEVALYYIKESNRKIPIVFVGNPIGYSEKFFRGQLDWSRPNDLNLLTNVYERKYCRPNSNEDILITRPCSTDKGTLDRVLRNIAKASAELENKIALIEGLKELVRESLKFVDKEETANILRWGLDPNFLEKGFGHSSDFNTIISLMVGSLAGSKYDMEVESFIYTQSA
jgi:nucleoside-diphosphate-sugar epimerase